MVALRQVRRVCRVVAAANAAVVIPRAYVVIAVNDGLIVVCMAAAAGVCVELSWRRHGVVAVGHERWAKNRTFFGARRLVYFFPLDV